MKIIAISCCIVLCLLSVSHGTVLFSDNFDSCSSGCTVGMTEPNSPSVGSYTQWHIDETTCEYGGTTHNSGEITSTGGGRSGTGGSFKIWRAQGCFGNYSGALLMGGVGAANHFFLRYYLKMPSAFASTADGTGFKLFRMNVSGGDGEIYVNQVGSSKATATWQITNNSSWVTVLNNTKLQAIWDGNWHAIQWEFDFTGNALRLYIDGSLTGGYENASFTWTATGTVSQIQHLVIGNTFDHDGAWQASWQAVEVDDIVLATTKAETDHDGGDVTAPTQTLVGVTISGGSIQ